MADRNNAASDLRAAAAKYYDFPQISMSTSSAITGQVTCFCIPLLILLLTVSAGLAVDERVSWATERAPLRLTFHFNKKIMLLIMKAAFPKPPIPEIKAVAEHCVK